MINAESIEIRVKGKVGNDPLSPKNFDIKELRKILDIVDDLLFPNGKNRTEPVTYEVETGSVVNLFRVCLQAKMYFMSIMTSIATSGNLNGLDSKAANAIQTIQEAARKNGFTYEFGSPDSDKPALVINNYTDYRVNENLWVNAELYLYGYILNAGGKDKCNIHLQTVDFGTLIINADKDYIASFHENILYQQWMVRVLGQQNLCTGAINPTSLQMIEMEKIKSSYDENYLDHLIENASPNWKDIKDPVEWVDQIRGNHG